MESIDVSATPLKDWNSSSEWKSMDSTTKGLFSQLLLVASFNKPAGYLPDDDKLWRKWLNIPSPTLDENDYDEYQPDEKEVAKTIKKYFDNNKTSGISASMLDALESIWETEHSTKEKRNARFSYDSWINYLWVYQWKPALLNALVKIDVKVRMQFDELEGYEGYFFPIAYSMANMGSSTLKVVAKEKKKTTRKKGKKASLPLPNIFEAESLDYNDIGHDGILWINTDSSPLHDLAKVMRVWRTPINSESRQSIWTVGVSQLESSISNHPKAKRFLGLMVKNHGEAKVVKTIADMSRSLNGAYDPYALFTKIITSYDQGTIGEQKARAQRATVSL